MTVCEGFDTFTMFLTLRGNHDAMSKP